MSALNAEAAESAEMTAYAGPFVLRPACDLDDHDRAFRSALMTFAGSEDRWSALARYGATDAQIREQLAQELGISGGGGSPGNPWHHAHRGGKSPAVWVRREIIHHNGRPDYEGQALIDKTRRVLGIGLTNTVARILRPRSASSAPSALNSGASS